MFLEEEFARDCSFVILRRIFQLKDEVVSEVMLVAFKTNFFDSLAVKNAVSMAQIAQKLKASIFYKDELQNEGH